MRSITKSCAPHVLLKLVLLCLTLVVPALAEFPSLKQGANGADVQALQHLLTAQGISTATDGDYGPKTKASVTAFQQKGGLTVDGVAGPNTLGAVIITVKRGSVGPAVKGCQVLLTKRGRSTPADGDFGPQTDSRVRTFQKDFDLTIDGVVGPVTWRTLFGTAGQPTASPKPVPKPTPAPKNTVTVHVRTFIHQDKIDEPPLTPGFVCKGPGYGLGDDRGPQANPGNKYRTQVVLQRTFGGGSKAIATSRTASDSEWPGGSCENSASGIEVTSTLNGVREQVFRIKHAAETCACPSAITPAIDYEMEVAITDGRTVTISGSRDQFPDMEVYAWRSGGSRKQVLHAVGDDPLCLFGVPRCTSKDISGSVTL